MYSSTINLLNFYSRLKYDVYITLIPILHIQALMCVALMSILYSVGTSSRSLTQLET